MSSDADSGAPAPLVPSDVDLSGYGFMPLYGDRLFGSDFNAHCTDEEWRAGVTLWWAAWKQIPASSLPDDDIALCRLADLGRDVKTWKRLRENALRNFVKCSDGRLYHKVLAEFAIEAWDRRVKERDRKAKWRRDKDGTETGTETGHNTGQRRDVPAEKKRSEAKRHLGLDRSVSHTSPSPQSARGRAREEVNGEGHGKKRFNPTTYAFEQLRAAERNEKDMGPAIVQSADDDLRSAVPVAVPDDRHD